MLGQADSEITTHVHTSNLFI